MDLREWTVLYVRHKDMMARKLVSHQDAGDTIRFEFKDHILTAHVMERLAVPAIEGRALIVTLHTKENVDALIRQWKEFAKHPGLTVIFVNLKRNEKWLIHPHTHESISDGKIEQGIRTLADGVTYA